MNKDKQVIIFVPRNRDWIIQNSDVKLGDFQGDSKANLWKETQKPGGQGSVKLFTLDEVTGKFDIGDEGQIYVFSGHGMSGNGESTWNGGNGLMAERVAELTAERFPEGVQGIRIKIYHCHSAEGGINSFASRFARAFNPKVNNCSAKIYGYCGLITPGPQKLTGGNVSDSKTNAEKKGRRPPTEDVVIGAHHHWSKAEPFNNYQSRASEARLDIALFWVKNGVKSLSMFGPF